LTYRDCGGGPRHVKITGATPGVARIGSRTAISITGESNEDVADGTMSIKTDLTPLDHFPWTNCSLDASRGGECGLFHNNNVKGSPLATSCTPGMEAACHKWLGILFGSVSVTMEAFNFPIAAGPLDINMNLHLTKLFGESETKVTLVSQNGEKVFCINTLAGKKDKRGVRPLTYSDCGDAQTHAKIVGMFPTFLREGEGTRLTVKAVLDSAIAGLSGKIYVENTPTVEPAVANWAQLADCLGAAGEKIECPLKLKAYPGTPFLPLGAIRYSGMNFPIWKGPTSFNVELSLNPLIPEILGSTYTRLRASSKSGVEFFCLEVKSEGEYCSRHPDFCGSAGPTDSVSAVVLV